MQDRDGLTTRSHCATKSQSWVSAHRCLHKISKYTEIKRECARKRGCKRAISFIIITTMRWSCFDLAFVYRSACSLSHVPVLSFLLSFYFLSLLSVLLSTGLWHFHRHYHRGCWSILMVMHMILYYNGSCMYLHIPILRDLHEVILDCATMPCTQSSALLSQGSMTIVSARLITRFWL